MFVLFMLYGQIENVYNFYKDFRFNVHVYVMFLSYEQIKKMFI